MNYKIILESEVPSKYSSIVDVSVKDNNGVIVGRLNGELFSYGIRLNYLWFSDAVRQTEQIVMAIANQLRILQFGKSNISLAS